MPDGADPPADAYDQARRCLEIILAALAEAGASAAATSCARGSTSRDAALIGDVGRAHGEVFGDVRPATTGVVVGAPRPALAGRDRGGGAAQRIGCAPVSEQAFPPSITAKTLEPGGSVLDHTFGKSDPYTLGVEEEYMLLDGETLDLVQHIDTVLAAVAGHELEPRINAELMQSVLEITTPVCRTAARRRRRAAAAPHATSTGIAHEQRPARRLGGHAPVQPLRAPADHGEGPLPRSSSTSCSTSRAAS